MITAYIHSETEHVEQVQSYEELINQALSQALLDPAIKPDTPYVVGISMMDDLAIEKLNTEFRNKNKPTNILSFPDGETMEEEGLYLGDLAISVPTLVRESQDLNIPVSHHLQHLTIHGLLHLLGFDHETDNEAEEMESLEIAILQTLDIKNPYEEPADCGKLDE